MSRALRDKVRVMPHERLRRMEAVASVAMLELSTSFRRHVNRTLRDMFVLMSAPRHDDNVWRSKLHDLARDLQSVGGSFDYGLLTTIGEAMCRTIKDEALPTESSLQRKLAAYAAALDAIIRIDLKGDGGDDGRELLSVLRIKPAA
ncbi:hypothetical protein [Dongia deserti]|uniref:hypothetical protein n=1 Tax=Dongia deserti TaxID=2268030 RepID=UPI000E64B8D1|nr:hypothetical protein [Dongia deserti]